ncbi:MAG: hypothetical protein COU72_00330 [Parcubacteria group bacterium CG10_big_fil_rev_8_21_14_0_10_41_35]|nr:MAG: hypothetical protein COU72_00330 [Parcubacteria group bacterium CG10_big_fil_rev_8_21_14_0_10_41_35]
MGSLLLRLHEHFSDAQKCATEKLEEIAVQKGLPNWEIQYHQEHQSVVLEGGRVEVHLVCDHPRKKGERKTFAFVILYRTVCGAKSWTPGEVIVLPIDSPWFVSNGVLVAP